MNNIYFIFISLILYCFLFFCNGKEVCGDKEKCISKCCPGKAYFNASEVCVENGDFKEDFSTVPVYNKNLTITGTVKDTFTVIDGEPFPLIPDNPLISRYLMEDGNLYIEMRRSNVLPFKKTIKTFCVDYIQKNDELVLCFGELDLDDDNQGNSGKLYLQVAGFLVSSAFLLLTLIVYWLLKELRNLQGKLLMAYSFSLLSAHTLMAIMQIISMTNAYESIISDNYCYGFTTAVYFFILSSCCWMNVMSFDIWSAFRTTRELRRASRSKKKFSKLIKYSIYAWGIPLIMAIALISIDKTDLTEKPWIIKPDIFLGGCFLYDERKLIYLNIPMLILILINWIFYLMTAFNYCQAKSSTMAIKTRTSNRHQSDSESIFMYLKLSLVMGVSWIFEVLSNLQPDLWLWYISDLYNMFIGVALFVIFVCKKRIFDKLSKRFRKHHSSSEDVPQETITMSTSNY